MITSSDLDTVLPVSSRNDELDELLNGAHEDMGEPVQFEKTGEPIRGQGEPMQQDEEDTDEEMPKVEELSIETNKTKIKLTQFANFIETEG